MARIRNPFVVTGKIAPEYFCDRVEESARLIKSVYQRQQSRDYFTTPYGKDRTDTVLLRQA